MCSRGTHQKWKMPIICGCFSFCNRFASSSTCKTTPLQPGQPVCNPAHRGCNTKVAMAASKRWGVLERTHSSGHSLRTFRKASPVFLLLLLTLTFTSFHATSRPCVAPCGSIATKLSVQSMNTLNCRGIHTYYIATGYTIAATLQCLGCR